MTSYLIFASLNDGILQRSQFLQERICKSFSLRVDPVEKGGKKVNTRVDH